MYVLVPTVLHSDIAYFIYHNSCLTRPRFQTPGLWCLRCMYWRRHMSGDRILRETCVLGDARVCGSGEATAIWSSRHCKPAACILGLAGASMRLSLKCGLPWWSGHLTTYVTSANTQLPSQHVACHKMHSSLPCMCVMFVICVCCVWGWS